ncbi:MAG TPA: type II CAAX endopeptidase family protein [Actinomycetota bacterium]|nr:type II CAAX endopeptidase family protein [Actinomycetota bacterium]
MRGRGVGVGLVLVALAVATAVDHAVAGAHLAVGLGLAACLAVIARAQGLTVADLGLARPSWAAGLRWGAAAAAVVAAAYALGVLVAPLREAVPGGEGQLGPGVLWTVLVVVPVGTVLPEELAFRGVLLALLGGRDDPRTATLVSSALFGLWHVQGSLGGGMANATIAAAVGGDAAGITLRVLATVLFTSLAGVALCWLRLRSGSLLAPALAHWTVNGLGVIVALIA